MISSAAEIDVGRSPALHAAHRRVVTALANAEEREPEMSSAPIEPST